MQRYSLRSQWDMFKRVYAYTEQRSHYIWIAVGISLVLSVIGGFATYSFLPVFSMVFEGNGDIQLSAQQEPLPKGEPTTFMSSALETLRQRFNSFLHVIAGTGSRFQRLLRLVGFVTFLTILNSALTLLVDYLFIVVQADGVRTLRKIVFDHLCILPMSYYNRQRGGVVISRVENDIGGSLSMVTRSLSELILHTFSAGALIVLLFIINQQLVLLLIPSLVIVIIFTGVIGTWIKRTRKKILALQGDIVAWIHEFVSGIKVIRSFVAELYEKKRWRSFIDRSFHLEIIGSLNKALPLRCTEVFVVILSAVVIITGGWMIENTRLSVSELLVFFVVLARFQRPAMGLMQVWWNIQNGVAYAERIFHLLDEPTEATKGTPFVYTKNTTIVFDHVYFSYDQQPVITDVSFEVPAGKTVAIVGPSGSGKSTIVDLLMRFYVPVQGHIFLGSRDIMDISLPSLRSLFGVVTQDTFLFHDTIQHNILYGIERVLNDEVLIRSAKAAHAHQFIEQLPKGYNTVVGDRGVTLSGGERQRVAIARALAHNPAVLVFDEATSSLDSQSEMYVQQAIQEISEQKTTIVIAHRLSTITHADHIIVLSEGSIIEEGTHDHLLTHDGLYRHLWQLQSKKSEVK